MGPFRPEDSSPVASVTRTRHDRTSVTSAFSGDLHSLRLHRYSVCWYGFTYCYCISFHPSSNALKLDRAACADMSELPVKLWLVFRFQDPVEAQCQLLCYFQLRLFFTHQPDEAGGIIFFASYYSPGHQPTAHARS